MYGKEKQRRQRCFVSGSKPFGSRRSRDRHAARKPLPVQCNS